MYYDNFNFKGVSNTVDALMGLSMDMTRTREEHISRNTILSMFGPWLSDASCKLDKGYYHYYSSALDMKWVDLMLLALLVA